ncbi:MAG: LssY C-terminal domain-containing protein [Terriglobia bacterium]
MSILFTSTPALRTRHLARASYGSGFAWVVLWFMSFAATFGITGRGYSQAGSQNTLSSGTTLYVRLVTPVSTKSSHLNQTVTAQVVREVTNGQGVLIPIGAIASGKIEKLIPSSQPADHARLLIRFTELAIPNHLPLTLTAHLTEVENARETVLPDGTIQGVLEKDSPIGRVDGMLDRLGSTGTTMEKIGGKTFGKPDTTIDYPSGTDLELALDQPLAVGSTSPPAVATQIAPALADAVQKLLADAPNRCESKSKKPGDPLNLVVIGSSDQILNAYKLAGWVEPSKLSRKSGTGTARAVWDDQGYGQAPVSDLYLFGHMENFAFEKMLNTFLKRHHLRLWRTTATTPDGREIWLGASTHDTGLDVHPGVISHAIDSDLDLERAKVGADLMASGTVAAEQLVTRPNPLSEGKTATGANWKTDGQLLVIELKPTSTM